MLIYAFIDALDNPIYGFLPTARARAGGAGGPGW